MKYFILTYTTVEDYIERRMPFRDVHLGLAAEFQQMGVLIMAGALNPADKAVLVFQCDDESLVEEFVSRDPYIKNGLVTSWEIREWKVVVGG